MTKDGFLTFPEFVVKMEYGTITEERVQHQTYCLRQLFSLSDDDLLIGHEGDCTSQPCPCTFCQMELLLKEYKDYRFGTMDEDDLDWFNTSEEDREKDLQEAGIPRRETYQAPMCTRPDIVNCHAKIGTRGRCMNGFQCPPLKNTGE